MTINVDGSNLTSLSNGTHDDFYPSFSPKNDRILFYSNRDGNYEIYSMNSDGTNVMRLTNDPGSDRNPRWAPDGERIAFVCDSSICVMNADGSGRIRLTDATVIPVLSRISWSPDGSRIVFYSSNDKKEMSSQNQWTLFSVSVLTKKVEQSDKLWRRDSNPDFSMNANQLIVDGHKNGSWESEDGGWEIFVINADGSGRRNLTANDKRNDWGAFWSPDGRRIAYASGMNDQYEIYIMDSDGSHSLRITSLIPDSATLVDSRDGQRYPTLKLGKQRWMARNLAFVTKDSWCYGNDPADCERNGRLYTWNAARKACPKGWRLPTDQDWMNLEVHLGMSPDEAKKRRARGTNQGIQLRAGGSSGFHAPISGYRRPDGTYARRGERAAFWLASEANRDSAWHRDIRSDVGTIFRSEVTKTYALSVRCVQ